LMSSEKTQSRQIWSTFHKGTKAQLPRADIDKHKSRLGRTGIMESFSLSGAAGWQLLSTLLAAALDAATFSGKFSWTMLSIKNTHATGIIIAKTLPGPNAPTVIPENGTHLGPGVGFAWDAGNQGIIDGSALWLHSSVGPGAIDITFIRKTG